MDLAQEETVYWRISSSGPHRSIVLLQRSMIDKILSGVEKDSVDIKLGENNGIEIQDQEGKRIM